MNALEASERLTKLKRRADALARIVYYLEDDSDFRDDVDVLRELQEFAEDEGRVLTERMTEVQV